MKELELLYARITDINNQSIPKRIGTYVITHTYDNIHAERYVGSTKNLYNRLNNHYNKDIVYIDLYITDDVEIANSLERVLIELINPATNIRIPSLSNKDRDLMIELLENPEIKKDIYNNTVKIGCRYLKYISGDVKKSKKSLHQVQFNKNVHLFLIKKQSELYNITGKKLPIGEILEKYINLGIQFEEKLENLIKENKELNNEIQRLQGCNVR